MDSGEDELREALRVVINDARVANMRFDSDNLGRCCDLLERHVADLAAGPVLRERVAALEDAQRESLSAFFEWLSKKCGLGLAEWAGFHNGSTEDILDAYAAYRAAAALPPADGADTKRARKKLGLRQYIGLLTRNGRAPG